MKLEKIAPATFLEGGPPTTAGAENGAHGLK
jgi:hypothetical protein